MGYDLHDKAAALVRDAGGRLVGRTRLQKVAYLAQLAGFDDQFRFEYRHYGPYSEELAEAMEIAAGMRFVEEEERKTDWGGWYSIYKIGDCAALRTPTVAERAEFVTTAAHISVIELELAATAAFLYEKEGVGQGNNQDPWLKTAQLKPDKAKDGRLEKAKDAYSSLRKLKTPRSLPPID